MAYQLCEGRIPLGSPIRRESQRVPFRKSRTVFVYKCVTCGTERRIYAGAFQGQRAVPGVGATVCGAFVSLWAGETA